MVPAPVCAAQEAAMPVFSKDPKLLWKCSPEIQVAGRWVYWCGLGTRHLLPFLVLF